MRYWLERDRTATFPDAFFAAMAEGNWLGIAMPEEYGGAGLGITEAAIMMQAVAESGAAHERRLAIHINIFGLNPVVVLRHRGAEAPHAAAADRRARTRPASASPNRMPASTPPRSPRAPSSAATAT